MMSPTKQNSLVKRVSSLIIAGFIAIASVMAIAPSASATPITSCTLKAGDYSRSYTESGYSLVKIRLYTLTVHGKVHWDGKKITSWYAPTYSTTTWVGWSSSKESVAWYSKKSNLSVARAQAKFTLNIGTQWIGLNIQSLTDYAKVSVP